MRKTKDKYLPRRRIILASRSRARQKLLRDIGIQFTAAGSDVKEKRLIKTNCIDLVIENALAKAKDVSKRFHSGIVIAADTVVLVGKKIVGKPRNIKDAVRTLKLLSRKPRWVYTGIAVVDMDNKKTYTACGKTKVYMYHLNDKQVRDYFKRTSPLGKAGSFDIQGVGGVFIDRIEGCYYNVVGLPMAKLAKILKKTGMDVL
ncbi:MAG: septum formation protein Maf [Omnitrophica bacterium RIFCSPLOWO2_01_FULL_45_24]|nr:MAG: septum formation protein Maf [Omnitrophica bacterium RIFCSPHIGHO2_02_FULL_46_20]OGW93100.1 MAG: septum formation protein Maf [Omnitrophica bacterium RIFCSPLOWO2_01_FULL_45_24]